MADICTLISEHLLVISVISITAYSRHNYTYLQLCQLLPLEWLPSLLAQLFLEQMFKYNHETIVHHQTLSSSQFYTNIIPYGHYGVNNIYLKALSLSPFLAEKLASIFQTTACEKLKFENTHLHRCRWYQLPALLPLRPSSL